MCIISENTFAEFDLRHSGVCVYVCGCTHFYCLQGTCTLLNTDLVRADGSQGDRRLFTLSENNISGVPVKGYS